MKKIQAGAISVLLFTIAVSSYAADPLPSWNDGPSKNAIVSFVKDVTSKRSDTYVPPAERIAVFDNDGTLWAEQPLYFQFIFAMDRVKALAPQHPEWQTTDPFKSVLSNDLHGVLAGGNEGLVKLLAATHTGVSAEEFDAVVHDWLKTARHPTSKRPYTDMIYQPMLEVLQYLRKNGFKTFIVSGGNLEFMRPWAEAVYGIPPEQVIGSHFGGKFEARGDGFVVVQSPDSFFLDDGPGKPVGIHTHIGRRPTMAFGNSDGDMQMIQYTTSGPGLRFGLIVHHTDATREWAYDRTSSIGKLDKEIDEATTRGWTEVDMKAEWSRNYPEPAAK